MKWFKKEHPITRVLIFFVEIASKLEKVSTAFSSLNSFPSLPTTAMNDRKQNNIVINNKPKPLFLEFS